MIFARELCIGCYLAYQTSLRPLYRLAKSLHNGGYAVLVGLVEDDVSRWNFLPPRQPLGENAV